MSIELTPVKSSNIKACGYDAANKTLAIQFVDGTIYHYHDVSKDDYDDLLAAKSIGAHVHSKIKGAYKFAKQDKDD